MRKTKFSQSISVRYTMILALSFSVLVLGFLVITYQLAETLLEDQVDNTLIADVRGLQEIHAVGGMRLFASVLENRIRDNDIKDRSYILLNENYMPVLENASNWRLGLAEVIAGHVRQRGKTQLGQAFEVDLEDFANQDHENDERDFRFIAVALDQDVHLIVGQETVNIEELEDIVQVILPTLIALALIVAAAGSLVFHLMISRRLSIVSDVCEKIEEGDLSVRIPHFGRVDEISTLSDTINSMLSRIEDLLKGIQSVSNNIAHDLRTPLTRLKWRLENLDRSDEVQKCVDELDALLATFNALLKISSIEARNIPEQFSKVNLSSVVEDVVELYEPLLDEKQQVVIMDLEKDCLVSGNRNLLFQSISNLIDNAHKYSSEKAEVKLSCHQENGEVVVIVQDTGPGVPPDQIEQLCDRFFRGEPSRTQKGNGLGLALVKAVVKLHDGFLQFTSKHGLSVKLVFPKSD